MRVYLIVVASLSCVAGLDVDPSLITTNEFWCPSDGRFKNPNNKFSYILCDRGVSSVVDCPVDSYGSRHWSLVFNGTQCVDPWECPDIDGTYRKTQRGYALFVCMNGEPSQYTCPVGSKFEGRGCGCPSASPCYHNNFECPGDGLYADPYSRTSFVECFDGRPHVKYCREFSDERKQWSLVFDGEKCVQPYQCPEIDNTFKRVRSGRVHYKCKDGVVEEFHCVDGSTFDGRGCRPPARPQVRPHFKILVQNRYMIKFEFANKVVTDTFDQVSWRWNRLVEFK